MELIKVLLLTLTTMGEFVSCYLIWLVVKQGKTALLLLPAIISLALCLYLNRSYLALFS